MKENEKKETITEVTIEVKAKTFNEKGQITSAIVAGSKLTKADSGRVGFADEDSLSFRGSNCGCGKMDFDYNSTSRGGANGTKTTTVEVDVKSQKLDMNKNELIDAIASGSKLTKADAGRALDSTIESVKKDLFHFGVEAKQTAEGECGCPEISAYYKTETTDTK